MATVGLCNVSFAIDQETGEQSYEVTAFVIVGLGGHGQGSRA